MSDNIEEQPEEEKPNLKDDLTDIGGEILKKRIAKSGASKAASTGVKAGGNAAASTAAGGAAGAASGAAVGAAGAASGAAGSLASAGSSAVAGAGAAAGVAGAAIGEVKNLGEAVKEGDATGVVDSGVRVAGVGAATYFGGAAGGAAASAVLDTEIGKKTTRGLSTIIVGAAAVLVSMFVLIIGISSYSSVTIMTNILFADEDRMAQIQANTSSGVSNYAACTIDSCTVDFSKVDKRFVTLSGKPTSFKDGGTNEESKIRVDRALSVVGNASKACCDRTCLNWCGCLSSWIGGHYGSGYATAHIQWYGMVSKGVAHPGDRNPPVGALLFWSNGGTTSNDFGHVATYVGSGLAVGNVSSGPGGPNIYLHDADAPERWGQQYLGWSENVFTSGVMNPDRPTCGCG